MAAREAAARKGAALDTTRDANMLYAVVQPNDWYREGCVQCESTILSRQENIASQYRGKPPSSNEIVFASVFLKEEIALRVTLT